MPVEEFENWGKKLLGSSLKIIAPTGQYDPTVLLTSNNQLN